MRWLVWNPRGEQPTTAMVRARWRASLISTGRGALERGPPETAPSPHGFCADARFSPHPCAAVARRAAAGGDGEAHPPPPARPRPRPADAPDDRKCVEQGYGV